MKMCSTKTRKIRLKESAKKRYQMIGLCLILIFSISLWCAPFSFVESKSKLDTREYVVEKGDTLWSIAENIKIANVDTREVVYDIMKCNDLSDSFILPNTVLHLPVYN